MDTLDSATGMVARAVRAHRQARGWSLGVLAAESGVSRALLSKLEAGGGNPSLETMWRLARAFDIALSSLLGEDDVPEVRFIPAGDGTTFRSEGGLLARLVLAEGRNHRSEIYEAQLDPGVAYSSIHPPGTEELVYCMEGSLQAGPEGREVDLSAGDALSFPGDVRHRYVSSTGARLLSFMSYPPTWYGTRPG